MRRGACTRPGRLSLGWITSPTATAAFLRSGQGDSALHQAAGAAWPDHRDDVAAGLAAQPREAVLFALLTLGEVAYAWDLAHDLDLDLDLDLRDNDAWTRLAKAYENIDPIAVLPALARLVTDLAVTGARTTRSPPAG